MNFNNTGAAEREHGWPEGGDNDEHSGVGFAEISKTFEMQDTFSSDQKHLTEFNEFQSDDGPSIAMVQLSRPFAISLILVIEPGSDKDFDVFLLHVFILTIFFYLK